MAILGLKTPRHLQRHPHRELQGGRVRLLRKPKGHVEGGLQTSHQQPRKLQWEGRLGEGCQLGDHRQGPVLRRRSCVTRANVQQVLVGKYKDKCSVTKYCTSSGCPCSEKEAGVYNCLNECNPAKGWTYKMLHDIVPPGGRFELAEYQPILLRSGLRRGRKRQDRNAT